MSIIQDIRDKYAKVAVVAIALALIGFILTDYFSGRGQGQVGGSTTLGSVNGTSIKADAFARKVEQAEVGIRNQGYPAAAITSQAVEQVWTQEVNDLLLDDEVEKLGLTIGKKELGEILYGASAPPEFKQQLSDSNGYDPVRAKQRVDMMMKDKTVPQEQKDNFNAYVDQLVQMRLSQKYIALLANSTNFPRWFVEKQDADNSQIAKVSLVRESYAAIADSTVTVTDKEIQDYINKNKNYFKQEESRSIAFVTFSASPTAADSATIMNQLLADKPEFDTTTNIKEFIARRSTVPLADVFFGASQLSAVVKDTIPKLRINQVYGPFLDGGNYTMAKLLGVKTLPDSVKSRHILLGTQDRNGNPIMPDSVAKAKVDSVERAIRNGANFDTLETKYTTDQASHADKGVMTFASSTIQGEGFAKEFAQFILFDGKPGDKKVVKTSFGWHYIEIMSHINPQPSYKIAYLSLPIIASAETESMAQEEANQFAADARDRKGFDELFEKTQKPKNRTKGVGPNILPNAAQIPGVGYSRALVRAIYEAKRGEVLKPERVDDNYIVAVVTDVFEEGTKDAALARMEVEPVLRNKKKAEMLKQKIGKVTTLEAASTALGGRPIEVIDSVRMNATGKLSYEPKVSGATFNPNNKGKIVPEVLDGFNGVYVLRVDSVAATPSAGGTVLDQRKNLYTQTKQFLSNTQAPAYPLNVLRKVATIKDRRSNRY